MSDFKVTLAVDGQSDAIDMIRGVWAYELTADSWDAANPVAIKFKSNQSDSEYETIGDPSTGGSDVARIADGKEIIHEHGGGKVVIDASTLGTTTGLTLLARFVRR